jgi:hypothetical protein
MPKLAFSALAMGVALLMSTSACSTYIPSVDYSQPTESIVAPDAENYIHDRRFGIVFSIAPLLERENMNSVEQVRLIRNKRGYYFITAPGFRHVYVLEPKPGQLKFDNRIELTADGLQRPGFNQRGDYIEVVDRGTGEVYQINEEGTI